MYINTSNDTPITVDDKPLERVDGFTYLGCIVGLLWAQTMEPEKDISRRASWKGTMCFCCTSSNLEV